MGYVSLQESKDFSQDFFLFQVGGRYTTLAATNKKMADLEMFHWNKWVGFHPTWIRPGKGLLGSKVIGSVGYFTPIYPIDK